MATTVTTPNLIPALVDFITTFATPALIDSDHVLNGFERNITPPKDKQDFCVIQPISRTRRGTTVQEYDKTGDEVVRLKEYVDLDVQIDCYSRNLFDAASRAQTLETVARSFAGVDSFAKHNIDCQYADNVQNLTAILDEAQYQTRWRLVLRLGYWRTVQLDQPFVDALDVDVHNVDVRFPPA